MVIEMSSAPPNDLRDGGPASRPRPNILRNAALFTLVFGASAIPSVSAGMPPSVLVATFFLGLMLAALSAVDVQTFRLPDALTLPLGGVGLAIAAWHGEALIWHVGAAVAGYALLAGVGRAFRMWRGYDGLGLGDAKLFAAGGAWVGLSGLPTVLLISCVSALALVVARHGAGRTVAPGEMMAFGPFLAFGIWYTWLYGALA